MIVTGLLDNVKVGVNKDGLEIHVIKVNKCYIKPMSMRSQKNRCIIWVKSQFTKKNNNDYEDFHCIVYLT